MHGLNDVILYTTNQSFYSILTQPYFPSPSKHMFLRLPNLCFSPFQTYVSLPSKLMFLILKSAVNHPRKKAFRWNVFVGYNLDDYSLINPKTLFPSGISQYIY